MNDFYAWIVEEFLQYESPKGMDFDLYDFGLYGLIGLLVISGALLFNLIFYYIISRPALANWMSWTITGGVYILITNVLSYYIMLNTMAQEYYPDGAPYAFQDYLDFLIFNVLVSVIFYVFWMLLVRWKSTNSRLTPFPF
jgi:hypothetical protein